VPVGEPSQKRARPATFRRIGLTLTLLSEICDFTELSALRVGAVSRKREESPPRPFHAENRPRWPRQSILVACGLMRRSRSVLPKTRTVVLRKKRTGLVPRLARDFVFLAFGAPAMRFRVHSVPTGHSTERRRRGSTNSLQKKLGRVDLHSSLWIWEGCRVGTHWWSGKEDSRTDSSLCAVEWDAGVASRG
jgi:hypothetical protein